MTLGLQKLFLRLNYPVRVTALCQRARYIHVSFSATLFREKAIRIRVKIDFAGAITRSKTQNCFIAIFLHKIARGVSAIVRHHARAKCLEWLFKHFARVR